jgi:hypothetical protein
MLICEVRRNLKASKGSLIDSVLMDDHVNILKTISILVVWSLKCLSYTDNHIVVMCLDEHQVSSVLFIIYCEYPLFYYLIINLL